MTPFNTFEIARHELAHIACWAACIQDVYPQRYKSARVYLDVSINSGEAAVHMPDVLDAEQRKIAAYAALGPLALKRGWPRLPQDRKHLLEADLSERDIELSKSIVGTMESQRYIAATEKILTSIQLANLARIVMDKRLDVVDLYLPDLIRSHHPEAALRAVDRHFKAATADPKKAPSYV